MLGFLEVHANSRGRREKNLEDSEETDNQVTGGNDTKTEDFVLSSPTNVVHKIHVDKNLSWVTSENQDPRKLFQFKEKLGEGSFGICFKAIHEDSEMEFAIKQVEILPQTLEPLLTEIEVLKKCHAPNIVAYYGSIYHSDTLSIIMEYCSVGSMDDLLNSCTGRIGEQELGFVVENVLKGLFYLHSNHVVHRDIKPGNILINSSGIPQLADFGVAAQLQSTVDKRSIATGTVLYMAPEVLDPKSSYSYKADIWALGMTLIELATGSHPFENKMLDKVFNTILEEEPPTMPNSRKLSRIRKFVAQCLIKSVDDRPDTLELLSDKFVTKRKKSANLSKLIKIHAQQQAKSKKQMPQDTDEDPKLLVSKEKKKTREEIGGGWWWQSKEQQQKGKEKEKQKKLEKDIAKAMDTAIFEKNQDRGWFWKRKSNNGRRHSRKSSRDAVPTAPDMNSPVKGYPQHQPDPQNPPLDKSRDAREQKGSWEARKEEVSKNNTTLLTEESTFYSMYPKKKQIFLKEREEKNSLLGRKERSCSACNIL